MTNRALLSLVLITLFVSCSSSGKLPDETDGQQLIFGSGGGFTGIYNSFELLEDGSVFSLQSDGSKQRVKKLRKKHTRDIFEHASIVKAAQPEFNHPGNMSWFIKYKTNDEITEYKWGDADISVPVEIKELYNQLTAIIK